MRPTPTPANQPEYRPHVVVVGSGISGLSACWHLLPGARVTLLESEHRLGGHTHTHQIEVNGRAGPVDTGFIVFNHRTYPGLTRWFDQMGVTIHKADMSFAVSAQQGAFEWCGSTLNTIFAQRSNLLSGRFWKMLYDILRFNAKAPRDAEKKHESDDPGPSLGDYLDDNGYGQTFQHGYLLPMAGAIWSCPAEQMRAFPLRSFVRFCSNHGLLSVFNRPQWLSLKGGSHRYIQAFLKKVHQDGLPLTIQTGVKVESIQSLPTGEGGARSVRVMGRQTQASAESTEPGLAFEVQADAVVLACHSDQSLRLLEATDHPACRWLADIGYQPNTAYLHTDLTLMPKRRGAWAAWNYLSEDVGENTQAQTAVSVTYWMNQLQDLVQPEPILVSLNPPQPPKPASTIKTLSYAHPIFDGPAIQAQAMLQAVQGEQSIWLAGAWLGNGFHEDGYQSGRRAAMDILSTVASHPPLTPPVVDQPSLAGSAV
ncbi:MAG: FAD-dependent oxidoreductase [Betaproteobacteria bacterium]|nr:FAD-dependent oxidoreductase [Betaproteobacteria bacterium]